MPSRYGAARSVDIGPKACSHIGNASLQLLQGVYSSFHPPLVKEGASYGFLKFGVGLPNTFELPVQVPLNALDSLGIAVEFVPGQILKVDVPVLGRRVEVMPSSKLVALVLYVFDYRRVA